MKKKLIAAILSVAMVASMVPATAFAATAQPTAKAKTNVAAPMDAASEGILEDLNPTLTDTTYVKSPAVYTKTTDTTGKIAFAMQTDAKIPYVKADAGKITVTLAKPKIVDSTNGKWQIGTASELAGSVGTTTVDLTRATKTIDIKVTPDTGVTPTTVKVSIEGLVFQTKEELSDAFDKAHNALPTTSVGVTKKDATDALSALQKAYWAATGRTSADSDAEAIDDVLSDNQENQYAKDKQDMAIIIGQIAAREVSTEIKAIPTLILPTDETAINTAKSNYDNLDAEVKPEVTNYSDLEDAMAVVTVVKAIGTADANDGLAIKKFDDIATVKAATGTLTTAVDKLTPKQQSRVGNIAKYNTAVKNVANLEADTKTVDDLGKALVKVTAVTTQSEIDVAQLLISTSDIAFNKADKIVTSETDDKAVAAKTYRTEKARVQGLIDKAVEKMGAQKDADVIIAKINALPKEADLVLTDMAKVDALQLEYADSGAAKPYVDSAKAQYTLSTAKAKTDSLKTAAKTAATTDALKETYTKTVIDAYVTNAKLDNTYAVQAAKTALTDAFLVNTAELINAKAAVSVAEMNIQKEEALSKAATDKVINLIATMGDSNALAYKANVQNARTAYDALTADQKKKVTNYTTLTAAEEALKTIDVETAAKDAATKAIAAYTALPTAAKDPKTLAVTDKDKIYEIRDLVELEGVKTWINGKGTAADKTALAAIEALVTQMDVLTTAEFDKQAGALVPVKADASKADIDAAAKAVKELRTQYDGFSKGQKDQVKYLAKLTAAEAAVSTAYVTHANAQLVIIAAFDFEKDLTAENLALIKEEKACIEALTDAEKAKLDAANYEIFKTKALPAFDKAQQEETSLEKASVVAANAVYTGSKQTPEVTVTDKAGNVVAAENYNVVYSDNKEVGKATITVTSKTGGAYTGAATGTFLITPAKDKVNSLQVSKAVLRVNMEAMPGAKHQVWYKLTSGDSYSRINTSSNSKRLTSKEGIKAKKKYTVKAKAYLQEDGKTYYGSFSSLKRATTK